jgi:hypothetical protein
MKATSDIGLHLLLINAVLSGMAIMSRHGRECVTYGICCEMTARKGW